MFAGEVRRRKASNEYDVLIVPSGNGRTTRSLHFTPIKFWLLVFGVFIGIAGLFLVVMMYTPLTAYLRVPNPELERKYGREIVETQQQLKSLTEDVVLLKDYNVQLRKALGEREGKDTLAVKSGSTASPGEQDGNPIRPAEMISEGRGNNEFSSPTEYGDFGSASGTYNAVVMNNEGFRAVFPLIAPTGGYLSQGFDSARKHFGLDYSAKQGTPVYAAADGYVMFSGWTYDDGNMLILAHGGGYATIYKHNRSLLKSMNAFVKQGELIALMGTSGQTSKGPHLHFEVWKDGTPQDPNEYLLTSPSIQ